MQALHKCFRKALEYPQVMASPPTRLTDDFFAQVVQELGTDGTGPSAFKKLLQLLTNHFDDGDQGRAFQQLHSFGVPETSPRSCERSRSTSRSHRAQTRFLSPVTLWSSRSYAGSPAVSTHH